MFIIDRIKNRKNHEVKFNDATYKVSQELRDATDKIDAISMDLLEKNQELLNKAQNN